MTKEDLQTIIDQFDEADLKQQGVFGISQYGGGSDESFIRANKQGLELFAVQFGYSGDTDPPTGHTDPPTGFWLSKLIA